MEGRRNRRRGEDVAVVAVVVAAAAAAANKAPVAAVAELDAVVDNFNYLLFFAI